MKSIDMGVLNAVTFNSDWALKCIDEIAATSSKNEKISMVENYGQSDLFKRVLVASHDPYVTYGMNKIPTVEYSVGSADAQFDEDTWVLLEDLAGRVLTGNAAKDKVADELLRLTKDSGDLLCRIIRKDLKAGFGESTINKAFKKLISTFPYMRCSLVNKADFDKWDWELGVICQEKADGMFANVNNESCGVVQITSRQGSLLPAEKFPGIVDGMKNLMSKGMQYHGEILVLRDGVVLEREVGNGILNSVMNGGDFGEGERPLYSTWDAIPLDKVKPKGKYEVPYLKRLKGIYKDLLSGEYDQSIKLITTRKCHSLSEAYADYAKYLKAGKEGVVIKNPNGIWKDGTSKDQIKLKLEVDVDLKVVGIMLGKDGSKIEGKPGALSCLTSCGGLAVNVTIKNEAMRSHVTENPDEWIDSIIVVRSNGVQSSPRDGKLSSLFLPRMVEVDYRTDKFEADSLQQVRDQFESAIEAA